MHIFTTFIYTMDKNFNIIFKFWYILFLCKTADANVNNMQINSSNNLQLYENR